MMYTILSFSFRYIWLKILFCLVFYFSIASAVLAQKFNGNVEMLDSNKMPIGGDLTYNNQNT